MGTNTQTLMHAYQAATTHHCFNCNAWTSDVNILLGRPIVGRW